LLEILFDPEQLGTPLGPEILRLPFGPLGGPFGFQLRTRDQRGLQFGRGGRDQLAAAGLMHPGDLAVGRSYQPPRAVIANRAAKLAGLLFHSSFSLVDCGCGLNVRFNEQVICSLKWAADFCIFRKIGGNLFDSGAGFKLAFLPTGRASSGSFPIPPGL